MGTARPRNDMRGRVLVHRAPCHCEPRSGEAISLSTGTGGCFGHCAPSQRHAGACSRTPRPRNDTRGRVLVHRAPCHCEPRSGEAIPLSTGTGGCFGHCAPSQRHARACSRTPRPLSLRAAKRRSNPPFNWDRRLLWALRALATTRGGVFSYTAPPVIASRGAAKQSPFNRDRRLLATTYSFAPNPLEKQRVFLGVDFVEHLVNFVDQFLHVGL